ncbi:MAG: creatininase family protein [Verrucomicrobiales bacterium]|nr:creatininase family protein [Verrucomicrobiales bacterium]
MIYETLSAAALLKIDRENTLVVIPMAAVEQHGPHMPTGTDKILCTAVAEAIEKKLPAEILLIPTLWLGASAHHLRFGSTLDSALDTYIATLCDVARSLLDDGFKRILFLNGHGGNTDPMKIAVRELQPDYVDSLLAAGCYWAAGVETREKTLEGEHKFVGHACEFETSLMLHIRPDLVAIECAENAGELISDDMGGFYISRDMLQRTRKGFTGRPDLASAEKGKTIFEAIVRELVVRAKEFLIAPLGSEYEDLAPPPA